MNVVETIFHLFAEQGETAYFGENVSQLEHALQSAALAEENEAPATLITAALLHDIGHLLHGLEENIAEKGVDGQHEAVGEAWLTTHFPPAVSEPVRLHVAAKRYLCTTDPHYAATLSPASQQSLILQGGGMSETEVASFEANPFYADAVRLRYWDDAAKIPGLAVPPLEHYRTTIENSLQSSH
jgi:phosphonate degradation associated HDIG domain protein